MKKENLNHNNSSDQKNTPKRGRVVIVMVAQLIGLILALFFVLMSCGEPLEAITMMLDYVTLLGLIGFALPMPLFSGLWKDFLRAFRLNRCTYTLHELKRCQEAVKMMQRQFLYAGLLAFFFLTMIVIWEYWKYSQDTVLLLANLAVSTLSIIYMLIIEAFLSALNTQVKIRLIDYMEEE